MSVMENFRAGLVVTGLGMGLVFLTLVIVMYLIKLLGWAFKPRQADAVAATTLQAAAAGPSAPPATDVASDASTDEIAAIAVAIALAKGKAPPATVARSIPRPVSVFGIAYEDEISGDVVTVTSIDTGPGTWKGHGRLKALQ